MERALKNDELRKEILKLSQEFLKSYPSEK